MTASPLTVTIQMQVTTLYYSISTVNLHGLFSGVYSFRCILKGRLVQILQL